MLGAVNIQLQIASFELAICSSVSFDPAGTSLLKHEPDIDSAVLTARPTAIAGRGEKAVVAASRGVRMIVTVLDSRVWPPVCAHPFRMRCGMLVAMLRRHLLVVAIIRPVLCAHVRRSHGGQCEREHSKDHGL
jgi:hypothetical protein